MDWFVHTDLVARASLWETSWKKAGNCVFQTRCEQVILCLERCITFRLIVPHEYIQNETVSVQTYIIPTDTLHWSVILWSGCEQALNFCMINSFSNILLDVRFSYHVIDERFKSVLFNTGSAKHVVGLRGFEGFREGFPFFRGNQFLLKYVDASLWIFLDHRAAFRLQVGQLVVHEVECR